MRIGCLEAWFGLSEASLIWLILLRVFLAQVRHFNVVVGPLVPSLLRQKIRVAQLLVKHVFDLVDAADQKGAVLLVDIDVLLV